VAWHKRRHRHVYRLAGIVTNTGPTGSKSILGG